MFVLITNPLSFMRKLYFILKNNLLVKHRFDFYVLTSVSFLYTDTSNLIKYYLNTFSKHCKCRIQVDYLIKFQQLKPMLSAENITTQVL